MNSIDQRHTELMDHPCVGYGQDHHSTEASQLRCQVLRVNLNYNYSETTAVPVGSGSVKRLLDVHVNWTYTYLIDAAIDPWT